METQHIAESSRKEKENRIMRFYGQNVLKSLAVLGTIVIFLSIFFLCLPTIQSYGLTSNSQEMAENTSVEGRKTISSDKILLENQTEKQYIPVLLPPHNKSIPNVATATLLDYQSHLNDCAKRFKDVHGHWAEKSGILDLALSEKLINGFSYHTFGPNESITRGQVATILFNFAKSNEDTTVFTFTDFFSSPSSTDIENNTTPFTDNPNGKYYTGSMNWCYDNSIFTGYDLLGTEKICAAAQPITRAELCAVLHRFASCLYGDGNASEAGPSNNNIKNMSDYNDIPNWSINDCIWANNEKLITGKPGNLFAPNDNTTRAEAVKMISYGLFDSNAVDKLCEYFSQLDERYSNTPTKIHIIADSTTTDSIIIESAGMFGIVDSGEDDDYPDGTDETYPQRDGIIQGHGMEEKDIAYMNELGISDDNLIFYLGTHPHSDHIGSADEIINTFVPDYLLTPTYDDNMITDKNRLWDNQYVYDNMVAAAENVGATIVHTLDYDTPGIASDISYLTHKFYFGNCVIEIFNATDKFYQIDETTGDVIPTIYDANSMSWCVKVSNLDGSTSMFLAADINNKYGSEDEIAEALYSERTEQVENVSIYKLAHHGYAGSNSYNILNSAKPDILVATGPSKILNDDVKNYINDSGCEYYSLCDKYDEGSCDSFIVSLDNNGGYDYSFEKGKIISDR